MSLIEGEGSGRNQNPLARTAEAAAELSRQIPVRSEAQPRRGAEHLPYSRMYENLKTDSLCKVSGTRGFSHGSKSVVDSYGRECP